MAYFIESLCPALTKFTQENVSALSNQTGCLPSRYLTSESLTEVLSCNQTMDADSPKPKMKEAAGGIFSGMQIVLVLSSEESKLKANLRKRILENNGQLSYIVTNATDFVVCGEKEVSLVKLKTACRYNCPIVTNNYIDECLSQNSLLPVDDYLHEHKSKLNAFQEGRIACSNILVPMENKKPSLPVQLTTVETSSLEGYELVKYAFLKGANKVSSIKGCSYYHFATVEIHVRKSKNTSDMFCVFVHEGKIFNKTSSQPSGECLGQFVNTAKDAVSIYCNVYRKMTGPPKFLRVLNRPQHPNVGSPAFQELLKMVIFSDENFDPKLMSLVILTWNEARMFLSRYLAKPDIYPEWKVRDARTILIQIIAALSEGKNILASRLSKEFYATLAFKSECSNRIETVDDLLQRFQVCNLLIITSAIFEATSSRPNHVLYFMYTSLKCQVFHLHKESTEYKDIKTQILNSQTADVGLVIHNVYSLKRNLESANFTDELKNQKLLYHGTLPSNVISVLANGLVRRLAVMTAEQKREYLEDYCLGHGIYFTNSVNGCLKYCEPSGRGTMFVFISRVALGEIFETCDPDPSLIVPPTGFNSVLGVKNRDGQPSFFHEDEYVIYQERQQELRYLVEFSLESHGVDLQITDKTKDFFDSGICLEVDKELDEYLSYKVQNLEDLPEYIPDVCSLKRMNVPPDSTGSDCYLESTHVRARIVDLVARITVFQVYKNNADMPSEVRYTFPLCGGAAICGFEAFIGGKHVVGEVKEKETAHKEYEQAVSEGHGAYLLDEENPNLFTARLGNLPANTKAIIKITYIAELSVLSDILKLNLPGSISPCQNDILDLAKAHTEEILSFEACIEMATNIQDVFSTTHPLQVKKTDTKAVVKLRRGCNWETGLEISIRMCEVHIPRMWIEKHPEKGSEVCMVSYYPEFEDEGNLHQKEVVLLLDASNSMRGESFQTALTLAMLCLKNFDRTVNFNIVAFGCLVMELFPESQVFNERTKLEAQEFLRKLLPDMGGNNLAFSLMSCNISGKISKTNVFLITDGWFDNENQLYSTISKLDNIRLFTLAVSEKANLHFMKRAARCSGGSYEEYFQRDKNNWERTVKDQILKSGQLSLSDIKIEWQIFDSDGDQIVQAPQKIKNLFNGSFLVVYGFVCNCTVATLKAKIDNREYEIVVSSHKMSQITGNFLHTLCAKACIDDWEEGLLDEVDVLQTAKKESSKEGIIAVAKEYNLVSSLTSFIAVEKRQEGEVRSEEPSLKGLLKECNVDVLSYISFEDEDFPEDLKKINSLKIYRDEALTDMLFSEARLLEKSNLSECKLRKMLVHSDPIMKLSENVKKKKKKAMSYKMSDLYDEVPERKIFIQKNLLPGSTAGGALKRTSKMVTEHSSRSFSAPQSQLMYCEQEKNQGVKKSILLPDQTELDDNFTCGLDSLREELLDYESCNLLSTMGFCSDKWVESENTFENKLKLIAADLKGLSKSTLMNRSESSFLVPFVLVLYDPNDEGFPKYDHAVITVIQQVLAQLGGGVPLCDIILKAWRSECQSEYGVDIVKTVSKILEDADCCNEITNSNICHKLDLPETSTYPRLEQLEAQLLLFIRKMEENGLKSLGTLISNSICQLARLLFAVYYYFVERCIPFLLDNGLRPKDITTSNDVLKFMTKLIANSKCEAEAETHVFFTYLVWIHLINEKYPLVYSTLDLGSSWESAVLEYIREVF